MWKIEFLPEVKKDLKKIDHEARIRIFDFLNQRVSHLKDPRSIGEALKGSKFGEFWKYRVGDYRIINSIKDKTLTILVIKIGNRKEIYKR